jgi:magnesium-transporting ATPase (P-type)
MLTGDKLETAENIAESCRLLIPSMRIHKILSLSDSFKALKNIRHIF